MKDIEEKHIVVVLGMHRSGTSVVTRGLRVLGVDLGDNLLLPAQGVNDKGFWEDADIAALDNELLWTLGHDWHTLTPIRDKEFTAPEIDKLKQRAVALLLSKLDSTNSFGLKDPRIPRLLPFWQDVFAHIKARVSYVIAYRHPVSVALSLEKRDGFDHVKSHSLWFQHMLASLLQTQGSKRVVVNYDQVMNDPEGQLARMANALGLTFNPRSHEFANYKNKFLDDTLRHSRARTEDLYVAESVPPSVIELHNILTEVANDSAKLDDCNVVTAIERLNTQLIENYSALRYMRSCEEKAWAVSHIAEKGEPLVTMATELLRQNGGHLAMTAAELLCQKDEHLATAAELLRQKDEHLATAAELLRQKDEHLATAAELVRQRDEVLANANARLSRSFELPWKKKS